MAIEGSLLGIVFGVIYLIVVIFSFFVKGLNKSPGYKITTLFLSAVLFGIYISLSVTGEPTWITHLGLTVWGGIATFKALIFLKESL